MTWATVILVLTVVREFGRQTLTRWLLPCSPCRQRKHHHNHNQKPVGACEAGEERCTNHEFARFASSYSLLQRQVVGCRSLRSGRKNIGTKDQFAAPVRLNFSILRHRQSRTDVYCTEDQFAPTFLPLPCDAGKLGQIGEPTILRSPSISER